MDFGKTLDISAAGMAAQNFRVRVIAENVANANSLAETPNDEPYRRRIVTFRNQLDRSLGVNLVKVGRVLLDDGEFGSRFEPNHPAADPTGYVQTPNVKTIVEMMDLQQAQRSYEANLRVINMARQMMARTIELLR